MASCSHAFEAVPCGPCRQHHFVEDEQGAVPVADVAHGPDSTLGPGGNTSGSGSNNYRLGHECGQPCPGRGAGITASNSAASRATKSASVFVVALLVIGERQGVTWLNAGDSNGCIRSRRQAFPPSPDKRPERIAVVALAGRAMKCLALCG